MMESWHSHRRHDCHRGGMRPAQSPQMPRPWRRRDPAL